MIEWALPIWILDGDIRKAYDFTKHRHILEALLKQDCPKEVAGAWIREQRRTRVRLKLGDLETRPVSRTRALLQGDPAAPTLFNRTLDVPLTEFYCWCQMNKHGIPIGEEYLCILCFADNYWLFATNPTELQTMIKKWLAILRHYGWDTPWDELTYTTTAEDEDFKKPIYFEKNILKRVSRKEGFKALGTWFTPNNRNDKELAFRRTCAWAAFRKFSPILLNKNLPIKKRLHTLERAVAKSLFWCAGSWNLRADQCATLRGIQYSMVRKIMFFKRRDGEDDDDFFYRTNRAIKNTLRNNFFRSWDQTAHAEVHNWAGFLARLSHSEPNRVTGRIFRYRDWNWIHETASRNRGRQLHCRILKTWRWERPLYKYYGENWQVQAQDKEMWNEGVNEFIYYRTIHR